MVDTVFVKDDFNGSAGSMSGHVPNVVAAGTAVYAGDANWLLDGSGRATGGSTGTTYTLVLSLDALSAVAGVYAELEVVVGKYGSAGTTPPSFTFGIYATDIPGFGFNYNGAGGGYGTPSRFLLDTSVGVVDVGAVSGPTSGTTMLFRVEVDPYAQTTKWYKDSVLVHTQDDSAWYYGTETFDPGAASITFFDTTNFGSGGVENKYTRFEIGTLGLTPGASSAFWTNRVNSLEYV